MRITRDEAQEQSLLNQMRESFAKGDAERHEHLHLTDALEPRRGFFARVAPMPLGDDEVLYFVAGRGHEDMLARLAGLEVSEPRVIEGISMRPDFRMFGLPAEFKTRRANLAEEGEEETVYENYLNQLARGYCALEGDSCGWLIILALTQGSTAADPKRRTKPAFRVYRVEMAPWELDAAKQQLLANRDALNHALKTRDHRALPLCAAWKCGKRTKVMDEKPRCLTCNRDFESQWGIEKHTSSKTGAGHDVKNEVAHWIYEPVCKWHPICRPQDVDPTRGPEA